MQGTDLRVVYSVSYFNFSCGTYNKAQCLYELWGWVGGGFGGAGTALNMLFGMDHTGARMPVVP